MFPYGVVRIILVIKTIKIVQMRTERQGRKEFVFTNNFVYFNVCKGMYNITKNI